jgi:hypothetical protein
MSHNDEVLTDAYTSLGLLRAAHKALEAANPMAPEARPIWHESMKLLHEAISKQWKYTDVLLASCAPGSDRETP